MAVTTGDRILPNLVQGSTPYIVTDDTIVDGLTECTVNVQGIASGTAIPVSMGAVPTGGSTEAKQDTQILAEQAIQATLGATTGAAVITDANGTIQQYLRGLIKRWVDALGAGTAAAALRTTSASDDPAVTLLTAVSTKLTGAANYANGQVTAGSASGVLIAARATRRSVVIRNQDDADSAYIGAGTVTSGNGFLLKFGESISIDSTAAINCIRDTNDVALAYFEVYD